MKTQQVADRITRAAEIMGYSVDEHHAQTGTLYLECLHDDGEQVKIRVADHGECYCREDISVDPDGCSIDQAIRMLERKAGADYASLKKTESALMRQARKEICGKCFFKCSGCHKNCGKFSVWIENTGRGE